MLFRSRFSLSSLSSRPPLGAPSLSSPLSSHQLSPASLAPTRRVSVSSFLSSLPSAHLVRSLSLSGQAVGEGAGPVES